MTRLALLATSAARAARYLVQGRKDRPDAGKCNPHCRQMNAQHCAPGTTAFIAPRITYACLAHNMKAGARIAPCFCTWRHHPACRRHAVRSSTCDVRLLPVCLLEHWAVELYKLGAITKHTTLQKLRATQRRSPPPALGTRSRTQGNCPKGWFGALVSPESAGRSSTRQHRRKTAESK